jgi:(p)ppGpp synthase/HD superfamily hydrolase
MTREQGRTMLDTECRRRRVPRCDDATLLPLVDTFRVADVPHLLAAVGDGSVTVSAVLRAAGVEGANELSRALPEAPVVAPDRPTPSGTGLLVGGLTGLLIRTARCCDPVPGDAAVGFVTRGRGVSVHRDGCPSLRQALAATPERTITLDWGSVGVSPRGGERYPVTVHVRGAERRGFAADVTSAVASTGYSLRHLEFRVDGGTAIGALSLDVPSRSALESILDVLKRVRGVRHAGRVQESIGPPHD